MAAADDEFVSLIDATLASIPGRSVAPNTWWIEALDRIESHVARHGHGAAQVSA
ncbi:MAG: hypothetical protein AAF657_00315 [Acidobacteriota bacterium]